MKIEKDAIKRSIIPLVTWREALQNKTQNVLQVNNNNVTTIKRKQQTDYNQ